jgi:hypothetical protein
VGLEELVIRSILEGKAAGGVCLDGVELEEEETLNGDEISDIRCSIYTWLQISDSKMQERLKFYNFLEALLICNTITLGMKNVYYKRNGQPL